MNLGAELPRNLPKRSAVASLLILEDDVNLLELLVETFEDADYLVKGASGPDQALELAKKVKFDLVISDIRMAGSTDGLGVLTLLKKAQPELRTVVITGYASEDAPTRAISIQVDDYIYKPFRLPAMLDTVKRVLQSGEERQTYQKLLAKLWSGPRKMLENARLTSLQAALEGERDKTLQGYYVGIRSNHLSAGAAMDLWDRLEDLETRYATRTEAMEELHELGRAYRQVFELMTAAARSGSVGSFKNRSPEQLSRLGFTRLYDEIKAGRVGPELVRVAFELRRLGQRSTLKLTPELARLNALMY